MECKLQLDEIEDKFHDTILLKKEIADFSFTIGQLAFPLHSSWFLLIRNQFLPITIGSD